MKIFIDTGSIDEIKDAYSVGILDGVTTNPSLIKAAIRENKEKGEDISLKEYIVEILKVAKPTPVSLEVISSDYEDMVAEARRIYKLFNPVAENVYVKIPVNPVMDGDDNNDFDGIRAIKTLSDEGIPINCTLVFTPEQALLAAKAGASFVSPFAGRVDDDIRSQNGIGFEKPEYFPSYGMEKDGEEVLDDNGIVSGIDLVAQCVDIFDNYDIQSEVLASSMRNPRQFREAALAGADIATLPFKVIKQLLSHHKTAEGMKKFTDDVVPEYSDILTK